MQSMRTNIEGTTNARIVVQNQCRKSSILTFFSVKVHIWRMNPIVEIQPPK